MYDAVIVGAGVSGASTAWQLSRYDLKVALVERWADVGFGVSKANSGIIHGGFHHSAQKTLKAKLEILGNLMFDKLQYELDFPFHRNGILVVAFSEEQMPTVRKLYLQGLDNGVRNLEMCGRDRLLELEPKLNPEVVGGFYAPNGGTIEPYRYVFSLVEAAKRNGVELFCNFEAVSGEYRNNHWTLTAADGRTVKARTSSMRPGCSPTMFRTSAARRSSRSTPARAKSICSTATRRRVRSGWCSRFRAGSRKESS